MTWQAALLFYGALALMTLGLGRWLGPGLPWTLNPALELSWGVSVGLLGCFLTWVFRKRSGLARMATEFRRQLRGLGLAEVLLLAIASGVVEEWLFRGVLQAAWGVGPASLLFAAMHPPLNRNLRLWTVFALFAGLVLAALAAQTGSLLAPISCHVVLNAGNMGWILSMED